MHFKYSSKKALMAACTFCLVNSTGLAAPVEEFSLDQIIVTATRTPLEEKLLIQMRLKSLVQIMLLQHYD